MATATSADAQGKPGLLDRARIIAKPGFNRWLVPPAALCIHLCIGMAYGFSVFWKPLEAVLMGADGKPLPICSAGATTFSEKAAGTAEGPVRHGLQLEPVRPRLDVYVLLRAARRLRRHLGRLAGTRRPAQGRPRLDALLVRRPAHFLARRRDPSALDAVARLRRHRRHWPRPRLHLARLDADQMVPRPARHGDRHGHHGLRRRRR